MLLESIESGLQVLCLNRTDKKNAIALRRCTKRLTNALHVAQNITGQVKVTMLYGLGGDFSSGNDINDLYKSPKHLKKWKQ